MTGNRKRVSNYDDLVGYGWLLGAWNPAGKVEGHLQPDWGGNACLRKTLFGGLAAEATHPEDHYDFQVAVTDF